MSDVQFQTALSHRSDVAAQDKLSISLNEITDRGMIDLRGGGTDKAFLAAAKKVLGVDLPNKPRTSVSKGDITILWLSIDQWLVTCSRDKVEKLHQSLVKAMGDKIHSLAVNLSDARTIIRLKGDGAREILMKGAPVDLTAGGYGKGAVRRLNFAEIAGMVHFVDDAPDTIDLYVFRSYGEYAWEWLLATAKKPAEIRLFGKQEI